MAIRPEDKPLYQPWNEDDFSGDLLVSAMTPVQKWMYRTLLQRAFFHSTRPDLPNDPELLWRLAGCESRKQWDDNAQPVLAMFKSEDVGGIPMLYQKRLRADWDRLMDSREAFSDRGKKGAQTRWGAPEPPKVTQKELNVFKMIPQRCRDILGLRPEREEYYKSELRELSDTYGGTKVVDAFELWAKGYNGETRYPVKEFIRVADQYLTGKVRQDNPLLEEACVRLYEIGSQAFTGKYRAILSQLLEEASTDELYKAYGEFVAGKDDFAMKHAPKDFCEGGAKAIIAANRKRAEQRIAQERLMNKATERMRQEAEAEQAEEEVVEEEL